MRYLKRVLDSLEDICNCNQHSGYTCEICQYKIDINRAENKIIELEKQIEELTKDLTNETN